MNPGWDTQELGGAIRLYDRLPAPPPAGASLDPLMHELHTDICPAGGSGQDRLLLFWSDMIVHEVLPSWGSDLKVEASSSPEAAATRAPGIKSAPASSAKGSPPRHHRHTFTVWMTTENAASLLDPTSPLFRLREAHFPKR